MKSLKKQGCRKGTVNLVIGPGGSIGNFSGRERGCGYGDFYRKYGGWTEYYAGGGGKCQEAWPGAGREIPQHYFCGYGFGCGCGMGYAGNLFNQGEVCCAGSRIIIERSVKDEFVRRFAERAERMTLGNALDNPDMGPLVSEKHMNDVLSYIELGKQEGARLICGGTRYTEGKCAEGYFVKPAIFDGCTADMRIVREEIFRPGGNDSDLRNGGGGSPACK